MRKLFLLLDEWNNDRNFVGSELEEIQKHFDVTVICNAGENTPEGVEFRYYDRKLGIKALLKGIKFFFDKEAYKELGNLKGESNKIKKASEIIRFYINGEIFHDYLVDTGVLSADSDAIIYSYWYFWKCYGACRYRDKYPGIKVITRTHEYELYTVSIASGYQPFKRLMDGKLDNIVFIAEHGREYYVNRYGYDKSDKYLLYHLGTKDYGKLNPYNHGETVNIVSCSSVIARKRVELIVDALELITDVNVNWIHFGTGDMMETLRNRAESKLGSKTNVTYRLKGYTAHDEIMKYYADNSIDAFIMTAISEGNPVSVIEAMSFGIPVISANINNMPNLIKGNGVLLSANPSPEELAKAITECRDMGDEVRNRSREIWEIEYQADNNNRHFVEEVLLQL